MSKNFKLLLLPTLLSTIIYATNGDGIDEIINNATDATETISTEIAEVIIDTPATIIETTETLITPNIEAPIEETSPIIETLTTLSSEANQTITEEVSSTSVELNTTENTLINSMQTPKIEEIPVATESNQTTPPKEKEKSQEFSTEKGNPLKGKNIYKYVLKEDCNMTGYKFAEQFNQEEWEEILESNQFKETLFKTCPNVQNYYQDKWSDDLYQFFYEASDEDEIPEC